MRIFFLISVISVLGMPLLTGAYLSPGKPAGLVNDFGEMLRQEEKNALESILVNFERSSGNEISVVTIPSLQGDTIENFTVRLFEEWGIGKKGKDNGVLMLIARDDKKMRIEVGYGLEGMLTDFQSSWIVRNVMTPAFRNGNFYEGIRGAAEKIIAVTNGTEAIPFSEDSPPVSRQSSFDWFFLIFLIPLWLAGILGRSKSWWAGGVLGGVAGIIIGFIKGFLYAGVIWMAILVPLGLLFDYVVSKNYTRAQKEGRRSSWWIGGGGFGGGSGGGFGGGGFSGFGGGRSGGGGSSGGW